MKISIDTAAMSQCQSDLQGLATLLNNASSAISSVYGVLDHRVKNVAFNLNIVVNSLKNLEGSVKTINSKLITGTDMANKMMRSLDLNRLINKEVSLALYKSKNFPLSISDKYIDIQSMSQEELDNYFNDLDNEYMKWLSECKNTREKVTASATFLSTQMPKLPYYWGGGHNETKEEMYGINNKLGLPKVATSPGNKKYQIGNTYLYGYDCSGFVSWCLINSGYSIESSLTAHELENLGTKMSITAPNIIEKVQLGDLASKNGHIGIVIGVNKTNNEITVVHESSSGGGMNITTQSTTTGLITKDDVGANEDINFNNQEIPERIGKEYFTDVILMSYD